MVMLPGLYNQHMPPLATSPLLLPGKVVCKREITIHKAKVMSSRSSKALGFTEDEINDIVLKLQALLPAASSRSTRVPASKILQEICRYIRRLHIEVEDLSETLSQLQPSMKNNGFPEDILRSLLQQ